MADAIYEPPIKVIIDASITTNEEQNGHQAELASPPPPPPPPSILTRLHAGYFRISLSLGAQALLWKKFSAHTADSQALQHLLRMVPSIAFLLVWWIALCILILLSLLYFMRCIFHFHLVKSEFLHHVGVNYLFAPWISWLLLLQSAPSNVPKTVSYPILWWIFILPVIILDVKIYGQWFTTEKQFLSMVANPTSQLSVVGNLVGAWAAAQMGWKESSVCIFTLGTTHYLVVFITLYQRLLGSSRIPATLRPVFFLFVAAPSMASLAWKSISGTFDTLCKMFFFLSLFLFISLASRPALFKKSMKQFNVAWWAYSFPLTFLALASAEYASQVKGIIAPGLMLLLSGLSVLIFLCLMVFTALNSETIRLKNDPSLVFFSNGRIA